MTSRSERDDEVLQGCDADGCPDCALSRKEAHGGSGRIHMAVHVLVERPDGRLLLQKRSAQKRIQPGRWDTSVGGHVGAGEEIQQAVLRELEEELGIVGPVPKKIYHYLWRSPVEQEFVTTHHLVWTGPFRFPEEEIEEVKDWSIQEIWDAPSSLFTPNFLIELGRFLEWKQSDHRNQPPKRPTKSQGSKTR